MVADIREGAIVPVNSADDLLAIAELKSIESLRIGEYTGDEDTLARVRQQRSDLEIAVERTR